MTKELTKEQEAKKYGFTISELDALKLIKDSELDQFYKSYYNEPKDKWLLKEN